MENIVEQFNRYGQQFPKKKILQYVSFSNQLSGLLQFKQAHPTSKLPKNFHFPNVPNPTDFEAFIYLVSSIKLVADYIGFNCKSTIQGLIENFPKDIKIPLLSFQVINDFSDVMKVLGIVSSKISCYMDAEATAQQYIVILNRWYQDLKVFGRLTLKGLAFEGVYGPDKLLSNRDVHLSKFLNIFSTLTHKKSLQDFSVLKDFARYLRFFDPAATQYSPQIQTLFVKFRTYLLGFIEIYCFLQGNELDPQEILPEKYRQVLMNFWEQQEATEVAKVMLKKIESFRLTNKKNLKCRLNFQDQGIQALKNKFKALNDCNLLLEEKLKNISVQKAAYENKKNENSYVIRLLNQTIIQFNKLLNKLLN